MTDTWDHSWLVDTGPPMPTEPSPPSLPPSDPGFAAALAAYDAAYAQYLSDLAAHEAFGPPRHVLVWNENVAAILETDQRAVAEGRQAALRWSRASAFDQLGLVWVT